PAHQARERLRRGRLAPRARRALGLRGAMTHQGPLLPQDKLRVTLAELWGKLSPVEWREGWEPALAKHRVDPVVAIDVLREIWATQDAKRRPTFRAFLEAYRQHKAIQRRATGKPADDDPARPWGMHPSIFERIQPVETREDYRRQWLAERS